MTAARGGYTFDVPIMDSTAIETALRKFKGKIAPAARELGCSRAHLHEQVKEGTPLHARLLEIRTVGKDAVKNALAALVIDPDDVALRAMTHSEGPHAATHAVIVEKVAEATGLAKRELAKELGRRKYARRMAELLPAPPADHGAKKVVPIAISHTHRAWLAPKAKGTVPALLAGVTEWPRVEKGAPLPALFHTSFLLPKALHRTLHRVAGEQGASVSALVRVVLDKAMAAEKSLDAAPQHPDAAPALAA